ncbi:hypothetical protein GCM10022247_56760 [Allokutzneria multivorans]|uniref:ClpX-type ZB domain-containing protein n=1 Tax=Allokutzneria multivorans TaxID=1142134 RepID=A0ABP7TDZ7_9PSEU
MSSPTAWAAAGAVRATKSGAPRGYEVKVAGGPPRLVSVLCALCAQPAGLAERGDAIICARCAEVAQSVCDEQP